MVTQMKRLKALKHSVSKVEGTVSADIAYNKEWGPHVKLTASDPSLTELDRICQEHDVLMKVGEPDPAGNMRYYFK